MLLIFKRHLHETKYRTFLQVPFPCVHHFLYPGSLFPFFFHNLPGFLHMEMVFSAIVPLSAAVVPIIPQDILISVREFSAISIQEFFQIKSHFFILPSSFSL